MYSVRVKCATILNGKAMKKNLIVHGKLRKTFSNASFLLLACYLSISSLTIFFSGALAILKAYWAKLGGKPIGDTRSASKKRGRQSTGRGSDTPETSTKKQKKGGRKSKDASKLENDIETPGFEHTAGFTQVGTDDWKPPKVKKDSWDDHVQVVDTIEKDDDGVLWAYLLWNDKSDDGRYYRSKAKLSSCKQACPQRVGSALNTCHPIFLLYNANSLLSRC